VDCWRLIDCSHTSVNIVELVERILEVVYAYGMI
jgi:hypothetical protein